MRLKTHLFILSFFLIPLFGLFFSQHAFADTFTLSGNVQDSSGHAIGNATVSINDANSDNTTTDSITGAYSFSAVPGGTYNIQVTPPSGSGFSSAIALGKTISTNTTLNFILTPSGTVTLSGHVYDASGTTALQNQTVRLIGGSNPSTTTNSSGFFSLSAAPGTYIIEIITVTQNSLSVNAPQYYSIDINNYSLTQSTSLDFILPLKKVIVHAQDSSNAPVGNVQIQTLNPFTNINSSLPMGNGLTGVVQDAYGHNVTGPVTDPTTGNATLWLFPTDSSHSYTFQAVPPSGGNFITTTLANQPVTSDTTIPITMQQAVTLSGHVFDASGTTALQNQTVRLIGGGNPSTTTDQNGFFSLSAAPGTYTIEIITTTPNSLSVNAPQYYSIDVNNYSLTQNTSLNFTLPLKKVTVHAQDSTNAPVGNIQIKTLNPFTNVNSSLSLGNGLTGVVQAAYGNNVTGPVTDSTTGNATLWLFPTDSSHTYTFQAVPPNGSIYSTTTVSNQSITVDTTVPVTMLQPVTFTGHVYDASGTSPLQNQTVRLIGGSNPSTTTDANGHFLLSTNAGTYTLEIITVTQNSLLVNAPQYYSIDVNNFSLNQSNTNLDFTLPLKKVIVHVQDTTNAPVGNVQIKTLNPFTNVNSNLPLGNGLTGVVQAAYGNNVTGPITNSTTGDATLWLFQTDLNNTYTFQAIPPSGSIYSTFTLSNISITSDPIQTELVSLQYNHATPVTTASLSSLPFTDGTYSDPTTVTLSATAASGYTVANTYYTIDGGAQQTYTAPFTVTGAGSHTITYWSVDNSGVQEAINTKTFTITEAYSLSGTVYNDANQNGFQDTGEAGYAGATVTLNTGQTATTDSNGNYSFGQVESGTYTETLTVPNGYVATTTNPVSVPLAANTTENFGIAQPTSLVTSINAGGDTQGNYVTDADFSGGSTYTSSAAVDTTGVSNPAPQAVYQTVRYGNTFSYTIPGLTANGTYTVRLHFNELYWGTPLAGNSGGVGSRVFNVALNGTQVLSNYDIYEKAGGANKAIVEQLPATADANGNITISFTSITDNAMINGVEVYNGTLPSPSPTPTPTPATSALINAGGSATGNFVADTDFSGGTTFTSTDNVDTTGVTSPAPQAVYQTVRFGNTFKYIVPNLVPHTNYSVKLHFNELYWGTPLSGNSGGVGSRVFNVAINGAQVLNNFDIYQTAGGGDKAVVEEFTEPADTQGKMTIEFTTVTDNAMVNGIELQEQ